MSNFANLPPALSYCRTSICVKASRFAEDFERFLKTLRTAREMPGNVPSVSVNRVCPTRMQKPWLVSLCSHG